MSVEALLSTFMANQQIPIHTVPKEQDDLLRMYETCASYQTYYDTIKPGLDAQVASKYHDLIYGILEWSGFTSADVNKSGAAFFVYNALDNLIIARAHGLWIDPSIDAGYDLLDTIVKNMTYLKFANRQPLGTVGYKLALEFVQNMERFTPSGPVLRIYSAHDTTLTAMFAGMDLLLPDSYMLLPLYATSIILEMQILQGTSYVRALVGYPQLQGNVWTYTLNATQLKCPTLMDVCPLADFATFVRSLPVAKGCCNVDVDFHNDGCDQYGTKTSQLRPGCQLYRKFCPSESCGSEYFFNAVDDPRDATCVANGADTNQKACNTGGAIATSVVVTFIITTALASGIYLVFRSRKSSTNVSMDYVKVTS